VSYRIEVPPTAREEIRRLPGYVRAQARQLIEELADVPRPVRAKELLDKTGIYRIWLAGRWRIAYQVDEEAGVVRILRVRRKAEIDYDSIDGPPKG
jgi:mRNA-degrading endonuclease RelE of RelBE toxin-antitoxin system